MSVYFYKDKAAKEFEYELCEGCHRIFFQDTLSKTRKKGNKCEICGKEVEEKEINTAT